MGGSTFENLPKTTQGLLSSVMSTLATDMDIKVVTTKEDMLEVVMEVEEATLEVSEVLAEVPKSPRTPRLTPTPTKESEKDKKGKQRAIPVRASPRRNPLKDKPTTQEKGKAINMDSEEEEIKDILMDDEEAGIDVEEVEVQGANPITRLPKYVPPHKGKTKVPKYINKSKVPLQTPLLLDEIVLEGACLGWVPLLKLEDWDLANDDKFPHLAIEQLMCRIIDTTTGMTTLEPRRWLRGADKAGLFNLLWVPHCNRTLITVLVIKQILCLVHDGCLWLEETIPITDKLIHSCPTQEKIWP